MGIHPISLVARCATGRVRATREAESCCSATPRASGLLTSFDSPAELHRGIPLEHICHTKPAEDTANDRRTSRFNILQKTYVEQKLVA